MKSDQSASDRAGARLRIFALGEEPRDDLTESTTVQERIAMLRDLTERAWWHVA